MKLKKAMEQCILNPALRIRIPQQAGGFIVFSVNARQSDWHTLQHKMGHTVTISYEFLTRDDFEVFLPSSEPREWRLHSHLPKVFGQQFLPCLRTLSDTEGRVLLLVSRDSEVREHKRFGVPRSYWVDSLERLPGRPASFEAIRAAIDHVDYRYSPKFIAFSYGVLGNEEAMIYVAED